MIDEKKTVHSQRDYLFLVLLFGFIGFILMSQISSFFSNITLPVKYWAQLMRLNDLATKDYFYYLLNGSR
jgi:hypothetical protein